MSSKVQERPIGSVPVTAVGSTGYANGLTPREKFKALLARWRQETGGYSLAKHKQLHPAYLKLIGMGDQALPFLLEEVQNGRRYFFVALESITNEDPALGSRSFDEAAKAWLDWGRKHRLLL